MASQKVPILIDNNFLPREFQVLEATNDELPPEKLKPHPNVQVAFEGEEIGEKTRIYFPSQYSLERFLNDEIDGQQPQLDLFVDISKFELTYLRLMQLKVVHFKTRRKREFWLTCTTTTKDQVGNFGEAVEEGATTSDVRIGESGKNKRNRENEGAEEKRPSRLKVVFKNPAAKRTEKEQATPMPPPSNQDIFNSIEALKIQLEEASKERKKLVKHVETIGDFVAKAEAALSVFSGKESKGKKKKK